MNDNSCVTNTEFCWIKYGGNTIFDKDKNTCACPDGYSWNSSSTKCITLGQLCQDKLGNKSYYNSDTNSCNCYQGYAIQNNSCQPVPTKAAAENQTTRVIIPTLTPTPTEKPTLTPTIKPTKAFPTLGLKNLGKDFSVEELVKPKENFFVKIFQSIWDFVKHLI